tara:strand:- start:210 stop:497 length:288 start_codon:yes stop_codon:yes gene_type:complete
VNSAKIESGIVVNVAVGIVDGYTQCDDSVGMGWLYSDGVFTAPPQPEPEPPTIDEQIAALEASITPRNLRGAALGDQFAIDKIQAVEDEIQALRE